MHTDWKIYEEIIFHLIQNAVKFNKFGGSILFDFSYQELDFSEDFVLDESPSESELSENVLIVRSKTIRIGREVNKSLCNISSKSLLPLKAVSVLKRKKDSKTQIGYLITSITDTGNGLKKEKMQDLFGKLKRKG